MGIPIDKVAVYRARWPHGTKLRLTADIDDPFTPKKAGSVARKVEEWRLDGFNSRAR